MEMTEHDFKCWVIKDLAAAVLFSFGSLILEETSCHVVRTLSRPMERLVQRVTSFVNSQH